MSDKLAAFVVVVVCFPPTSSYGVDLIDFEEKVFYVQPNLEGTSHFTVAYGDNPRIKMIPMQIHLNKTAADCTHGKQSLWNCTRR